MSKGSRRAVTFVDEANQKEREQDLEKYYKHVFTCKICKGKYGSDINERFGICPRITCFKELQRRIQSSLNSGEKDL